MINKTAISVYAEFILTNGLIVVIALVMRTKVYKNSSYQMARAVVRNKSHTFRQFAICQPMQPLRVFQAHLQVQDCP